MYHTIKSVLVILLTTMVIAACSAEPKAQHDPYNSPDAQRERAKQTQDELSTETSR